MSLILKDPTLQTIKALLDKILKGTVDGKIQMPSSLRGEIYRVLDELEDLTDFKDLTT